MTTLYKFAQETRLYTFDFSLMEELRHGDSIASCTVTSSPGSLTVGSPAIVGQTVQVVLSAGNGGTLYTLTCIIVTSSGASLEGQGFLQVT